MSVEDVSQENLVRRIFLRYFLYVQIHRQISIEAKNLRYVGLISQRRGMIPGCHTLWLTNDAIVFFLRMTRRQARVYGTRDDIYDSQGIRQQFWDTQESRRWSRRRTFNSFAYCASALIDDILFCSLARDCQSLHHFMLYANKLDLRGFQWRKTSSFVCFENF